MTDANVNIAAGTTPVQTPVQTQAEHSPVSPEAVSQVSATSPQKEKTSLLETPREKDAPLKKEVLDAELREAVKSLGNAAEIIDRHFRLKVDDETDRLIIQVVDPKTNEVIRQFPEEEVLNIVKRLREYIGLVFDVEV